MLTSKPGGLQSADRGFTAGTRALNINFNRFQAMLHRGFGSGLGSQSARQRAWLLLEPRKPRPPALAQDNRIALHVGDGHNGVVEGGLDMRAAALNVFALAAFAYARRLF